MKPDEAMRLLGGYATGTLTPEERQWLFDAALENQDLFDALADEEALREALEDAAFRRRLLDSLGEPPRSAWARFGGWLRRPAVPALAGSLAAATVAVVILTRVEPPAAPRQELAMYRASPEEAAAVPEAAKAPERKQEAAPLSPPPKIASAPPAAALPPAKTPVAPPPPEPQADMAFGERREKALSRMAPAAEAQGAAFRLRQAAESSENAKLRYRVLRRQPDGSYEELADGRALRAADSARLSIEAGAAGFLYVVLEGYGGARKIFSSTYAQPGSRHIVPAAGSLPLALQRKLWILLSVNPWTAGEPLPEAGPGVSVAELMLQVE